MAIDLMALEPQQISRNLKGKTMLFFGQAGVGKTTLASQFEKTLICGFECGTNALNNVYVQPIKTWQDWRQVVSQLCKKPELKDKYHTISVDTVDEAWNLCVKYICAQNGVQTLGDIPWGGGYDQAKKEFSTTFRDLTFSGYGIIFISHSTEKTYKNDKGEEYTQIVPALPARPFDVINKMVDIIAYIREISVGTDDNPRRERFMFLRDEVGDRFLVKSRYRYIKPRVRLDYNELVNAIYEAIDQEVAHSGGSASENENPYTQRNFDELFEEAKEIWTQLANQGRTEIAMTALRNEFGRDIKFSEIEPTQVEELNRVLIEIRSQL